MIDHCLSPKQGYSKHDFQVLRIDGTVGNAERQRRVNRFQSAKVYQTYAFISICVCSWLCIVFNHIYIIIPDCTPQMINKLLLTQGTIEDNDKASKEGMSCLHENSMVMLVTTGVGALGLTLTAADRVIL